MKLFIVALLFAISYAQTDFGGASLGLPFEAVATESTGRCPPGTELTEDECERAYAQGEGYMYSATWKSGTCGCYVDSLNRRYFNAHTGDCNVPDRGDLMLCHGEEASGVCVGEISSMDERCGALQNQEDCENEGRSIFSDGVCDWNAATQEDLFNCVTEWRCVPRDDDIIVARLNHGEVECMGNPRRTKTENTDKTECWWNAPCEAGKPIDDSGYFWTMDEIYAIYDNPNNDCTTSWCPIVKEAFMSDPDYQTCEPVEDLCVPCDCNTYDEVTGTYGDCHPYGGSNPPCNSFCVRCKQDGTTAMKGHYPEHDEACKDYSKTKHDEELNGGCPENTVNYDCHCYATWDYLTCKPEWTPKMCPYDSQPAWMPIPEGWSLVEYSDDIRENVMGENEFGASFLVFADGTAHPTQYKLDIDGGYYTYPNVLMEKDGEYQCTSTDNKILYKMRQDTCKPAITTTTTNHGCVTTEGDLCTGYYYAAGQCESDSCCQGGNYAGYGWCGTGRDGTNTFGSCTEACASVPGFDSGPYASNADRAAAIEGLEMTITKSNEAYEVFGSTYDLVLILAIIGAVSAIYYGAKCVQKVLFRSDEFQKIPETEC